MNYKDSKYYFKKSVRFRKWSRKAYAVFASICYQVSIGHVSKDIADSALAKKEYRESLFQISQNEEADDECNGKEVRRDILSDILGINVPVQNYIHPVIVLDCNPENIDYYITDRKTFSQKATSFFG